MDTSEVEFELIEVPITDNLEDACDTIDRIKDRIIKLQRRDSTREGTMMMRNEAMLMRWQAIGNWWQGIDTCYMNDVYGI